MIRSDSGVAHRLSLSARVLSAQDGQVKAKRRPRTASAACGISYLGRLGAGFKPGDAMGPVPADSDITRILLAVTVAAGVRFNPGLEAKGLFAFPGANIGFRKPG